MLTSIENTEIISSSIRLAVNDDTSAISGVAVVDGKVMLYVWIIPATPVVYNVYCDDDDVFANAMSCIFVSSV